MFKVNNKDTRVTSLMSLSLLLTLNMFHALVYNISFVEFEQVNPGMINRNKLLY